MQDINILCITDQNILSVKVSIDIRLRGLNENQLIHHNLFILFLSKEEFQGKFVSRHCFKVPFHHYSSKLSNG